jgi:hypothetical protein
MDLEGSGEVADVAAELVMASVYLAEHLAGGGHDFSVHRIEGNDLVGDEPAPSVAQAPDQF